VESRRVPDELDVLAPDGSEIRLLPVVPRGSMVHCRLLPGAVTRAVRHRTVDELWYVLRGRGELWRSRNGEESVVELLPDTAHAIPVGTAFQFRCTGEQPLEIVIVTMPPWPGEQEAERVPDHWPPRFPGEEP